MTKQSFNNFQDLGRAFGHVPVHHKGKKMDTNAHNKAPLKEFEGVTKYYNHNKRFGFLYVTLTKGHELDFAVTSSDQDQIPGSVYQAGDVLDRDVVIEAFIHGTVIERVGYDMGLEKGQKLPVKIAENSKGIQVVWTQSKNGASPRVSNEARKANSYLQFVTGRVKIYNEDRHFGFVYVNQHPETGEPLTDEHGQPVELEVHFNRSTMRRAGYKYLKPGQTLLVRYWTYTNGRSTVAQFKFPDENTDPDTVAARDSVNRNNDNEETDAEQEAA